MWSESINTATNIFRLGCMSWLSCLHLPVPISFAPAISHAGQELTLLAVKLAHIKEEWTPGQSGSHHTNMFAKFALLFACVALAVSWNSFLYTVLESTERYAGYTAFIFHKISMNSRQWLRWYECCERERYIHLLMGWKLFNFAYCVIPQDRSWIYVSTAVFPVTTGVRGSTECMTAEPSERDRLYSDISL